MDYETLARRAMKKVPAPRLTDVVTDIWCSREHKDEFHTMDDQGRHQMTWEVKEFVNAWLEGYQREIREVYKKLRREPEAWLIYAEEHGKLDPQFKAELTYAKALFNNQLQGMPHLDMPRLEGAIQELMEEIFRRDW